MTPFIRDAENGFELVIYGHEGQESVTPLTNKQMLDFDVSAFKRTAWQRLKNEYVFLPKDSGK